MFAPMTGEKTTSPPPTVIVQAEHEPPAVVRSNLDVWAIPTGLFFLVGVPMLMLYAELSRSELPRQLNDVWEDIVGGSMLVGILFIGYGVVRRRAGRGLILLGLTLVLVVPLLVLTSFGPGNGLTDSVAGLCCLSFFFGLFIVAKGNGREDPDVVPRQHQASVNPVSPWAPLLTVFFLAFWYLERGSTSAMLFFGLVGAASLMLFSTMKRRNG